MAISVLFFQGATVGLLLSLGLVFWINGSALENEIDPIPKTLRIDGCPYENITFGELAAVHNTSGAMFINIKDIAKRE